MMLLIVCMCGLVIWGCPSRKVIPKPGAPEPQVQGLKAYFTVPL